MTNESEQNNNNNNVSTRRKSYSTTARRRRSRSCSTSRAPQRATPSSTTAQQQPQQGRSRENGSETTSTTLSTSSSDSHNRKSTGSSSGTAATENSRSNTHSSSHKTRKSSMPSSSNTNTANRTTTPKRSSRIRSSGKKGSLSPIRRRTTTPRRNGGGSGGKTTRNTNPKSSSSHAPPALAGAMLFIEVVQGCELVAKDRSLLGLRTSSDPFVQVHLYDGTITTTPTTTTTTNTTPTANGNGNGGDAASATATVATVANRSASWPCRGRTAVIYKTLTPVWNETVIVTLGADSAWTLLKSGERMELRIFDHDPGLLPPDYMGSVFVPLFDDDDDTKSSVSRTNSRDSLDSGSNHNSTSATAARPALGRTWYRVKPRTPNDPDLLCPNATGAIQARVTVQAEALLDLKAGDVFRLPFVSSSSSMMMSMAAAGKGKSSNNSKNSSNINSKNNNNHVTVGISWDDIHDDSNNRDKEDASENNSNGDDDDKREGRKREASCQVETYCVAMNESGYVALEECLYWDHWYNPNRSMVHSSHAEKNDGVSGFDKQVMRLHLDDIPEHIIALFFVVAIQGPVDKSIMDLKRLQVRFLATETQKALCRYVPCSKLSADHTAFIACRLARDISPSTSPSASSSSSSSSSWDVVPLGIGCPGARDFGALIPHFMACMGDLLPGIQVHAKGDRIALMRPERSIRVSDYMRRSNSSSNHSKKVPDGVLLFRTKLWRDKTRIPVDVAAVVLDKEYRKIDSACSEQPQSRDQSIQYDPDRKNRLGIAASRSGITMLKSPCITMNMSRVSHRAQYICFVISDQEEGDKAFNSVRASFSLEEERPEDDEMLRNMPMAPVAQYSVMYSPEKARLLLFACLYRGSAGDHDPDKKDNDDNNNDMNDSGHRPEDEWYLSILAKSVQGNSVADQGNALRWSLQAHPPPPPTLIPHKLAKRVSKSAAVLDELVPIQPNVAFISSEELVSDYLL